MCISSRRNFRLDFLTKKKVNSLLPLLSRITYLTTDLWTNKRILLVWNTHIMWLCHVINWTKKRFWPFSKKKKNIGGTGVFAVILMSVSGWVEDFIKPFGHLSSTERETFPSSPVCVSGEAGASHSTEEYLSFQLVRWIKWLSCREDRGKEGERDFKRGEGAEKVFEWKSVTGKEIHMEWKYTHHLPLSRK